MIVRVQRTDVYSCFSWVLACYHTQVARLRVLQGIGKSFDSKIHIVNHTSIASPSLKIHQVMASVSSFFLRFEQLFFSTVPLGLFFIASTERTMS
jgi:hypothetical protein